MLIDYIDIIFQIRRAIKSNTILIKIPYRLFYILLRVWSIFDKNPPFSVQQLEALVIDEEFKIIDWPKIFNVQSSPNKYFSLALLNLLSEPCGPLFLPE